MYKKEMALYEEMRKPRLSVAEREMKLHHFDILFTTLYKTVGNCATRVRNLVSYY